MEADGREDLAKQAFGRTGSELLGRFQAILNPSRIRKDLTSPHTYFLKTMEGLIRQPYIFELPGFVVVSMTFFGKHWRRQGVWFGGFQMGRHVRSRPAPWPTRTEMCQVLVHGIERKEK